MLLPESQTRAVLIHGTARGQLSAVKQAVMRAYAGASEVHEI